MTARLAKPLLDFLWDMLPWVSLGAIIAASGCAQPVPVDAPREPAAVRQMNSEVSQSLASLHDKLDHQQVPPAPVVNVDLSALERRLDQLPTKADLAEAARAKSEQPAKGVAKGGAPVLPADAPTRRTRAQQIADAKLTVYYLTLDNCAPCVAWHNAKDRVLIGGLPVNWRPISECPETFDFQSGPAFAWQDADGRWWQVVGWSGVEWFQSAVAKSLTGQLGYTAQAPAQTLYAAYQGPTYTTFAPTITYSAPVYSAPIVSRYVYGASDGGDVVITPVPTTRVYSRPVVRGYGLFGMPIIGRERFAVTEY